MGPRIRGKPANGTLSDVLNVAVAVMVEAGEVVILRGVIHVGSDNKAVVHHAFGIALGFERSTHAAAPCGIPPAAPAPPP